MYQPVEFHRRAKNNDSSKEMSELKIKLLDRGVELSLEASIRLAVTHDSVIDQLMSMKPKENII